MFWASVAQNDIEMVGSIPKFTFQSILGPPKHPKYGVFEAQNDETHLQNPLKVDF
jgi:hypothetical protein